MGFLSLVAASAVTAAVMASPVTPAVARAASTTSVPVHKIL